MYATWNARQRIARNRFFDRVTNGRKPLDARASVFAGTARESWRGLAVTAGSGSQAGDANSVLDAEASLGSLRRRQTGVKVLVQTAHQF